MSPKISVIIPVCNIQEYVGPCIESVLTQTYDNLDIIIINDGSTDSSLAICEEYASRDNRIKIISQENKGLSTARNTGINLATGSYVSFVEGKDILSPLFIEVLYNLATSYNADIAQCSYTKIYSQDDEIRSKELLPTTFVFSNGEYIQKLYNEQYYPTNIVCWNKLYKRELWSDTRFPEGLLHADEYTIPMLLLSSEKTVITTETLYGYMQTNTDTLSAENQVKRYTSMLQTLNERHKIFVEKGMKELASMTKLKKAYFLYDLLTIEPQNKKALAEHRKLLFTLLSHPYASVRFKLSNIMLSFSPSFYRRYLYFPKASQLN